MHTPDFSVGLVQAERRSALRRLGFWYGPFQYPNWVIDWCGYAGQSTRLGIGSARSDPLPRPARSWHIYPPSTRYAHVDEQLPPHQAWESLWFFFQLHTPWTLLDGRPLTVVVDADERLTPHLHAMFALQQHGAAGHQLAVHGHAQVVFGELLLASQGPGDGSAAHPWRIQPLVASVDGLWHLVEREVLRDLRHPPSIAELAERLALSPSSLCHRFARESGMSVMQRVRWLRIREARRLLARPGASVKEVARLLGFSSPFHLSNLFHALSGITAKDYIAQVRR